MRKIKKGDTVKIIKGKDNGRTGKVLRYDVVSSRVTIEGANMAIKHLRPRKGGEKGQRIQFPVPVRIANVALMCPACNMPTRVGILMQDGVRMRMCKKCKNTMV